MTTRLMNLTGDTLKIKTNTGSVMTLPSEGRCIQKFPTKQVQLKDCPVPVNIRQAGVLGLPDAQEGVLYIVPENVIAMCGGRRDVLCPAQDPDDQPILDVYGRLVAVTRLSSVPVGRRL